MEYLLVVGRFSTKSEYIMQSEDKDINGKNVLWPNFMAAIDLF